MPKFRSSDDVRTTVYRGHKGLRADVGRKETVEVDGELAELLGKSDGVSEVKPRKKKDE